MAGQCDGQPGPRTEEFGPYPGEGRYSEDVWAREHLDRDHVSGLMGMWVG